MMERSLRYLVLTIVGLGLVFGLGQATPAQAGWEKGVGAYNSGDYETALKEFVPLAKAGKPDAQFALGMMYLNGQLVKRDANEAAKWFLKAADQGMVDAQGSLGALYSAGKGVPLNMVQAYKWFDIAATRGNEKAKKILKDMAKKMSKEDVQKGRRLARKWRAEHRTLKRK
ncbi:MAG: tetratricopeptide repeat protein [Alphaproteobacteria bacterium]|nr:tetratricopeptide repeat protein [Alphaproteobacteria bacterium]